MPSVVPELDKLLALRDIVITVGIHEQEGQGSHDASGQTVADIAEIHEFGLGVPMRSFIRQFPERMQPEIQAAFDLTVQNIIAGANQETAMQQLALKLEGLAKAQFSRGIGPPLAPETIAKKGGLSIQLVDHGVLRNSVTAQVGR